MIYSNNVQRHTSEEVTAEKQYGFTTKGELPIIGILVGLAGGMLSLIVLFALVPVIGSSVDNAMPETDGQWNISNNPELPTGVDLWTQIGPLIVLCALIAVIMVVLRLLGVF